MACDVSRTDWISFFSEKATPPLERRRMLDIVLEPKLRHVLRHFFSKLT